MVIFFLLSDDTGFNSSRIDISGPCGPFHDRAEGALPSGQFRNITDSHVIICCRQDRSADIPIKLPTQTPFSLIKVCYKNPICVHIIE